MKQKIKINKRLHDKTRKYYRMNAIDDKTWNPNKTFIKVSDKKIFKKRHETDFYYVQDKYKGSEIIDPEPTVQENINNRFLFRGFTSHDFLGMGIYFYLKFDTKTFSQYLIYRIKYTHPIFKMYFKKSLREPLIFDVIFFFTTITLSCLFTAIFYNDDYIEYGARNILTWLKNFDGEYSVIVNAVFMIFEPHNLPISVYAAICCQLFHGIFQLILTSMYTKISIEKLNKALISEDIDVIKKAYRRFLKESCLRNSFLIVTVILLTAFSYFYCIMFLYVYAGSSGMWLGGVFWTLVFYWFVIQFITIFIAATYREIARKCPSCSSLGFILRII